MIASAYIVFGLVLLSFGARLMKIAITVYGGLLGLWLTSWLANTFHFSTTLTALTIIAGAILGALLFYGFYKLLVKFAVAFFVFNFAYGVCLALGTGAVSGIIVAALIAVVSYILMTKHDIVTKIFIVISSLQGATALITGIAMFAHGGTSAEDIISSNPYVALQNSEWGFWAALLIALIGISVQLKHSRHSSE